MELIHVAISNFKSFAGCHTFQFQGRAPGLYYVCGENRVQPSLGSNGAGKSTLWEAIYWCLYGKTPRNLRSTEVATWERTGPCHVDLTFRQDGREYSVQRSAGKSTLLFSEYDPESGVAPQQGEIDQVFLQSRVRLTPTEFAHTTLLGQGVPLFFDLPPSQKMDVVQDILDLSSWEDRSRHASALASDLSAAIVEIERDLAVQESVAEQSLAQHQDMKAQALLWKTKNAGQLKDAKDAIKTLEQSVKMAEAEAKALDEDRQDADSIESELVQAREAHRRHAERTTELKWKVGRIREDRDEYQGAIEEMNGLGGKCGTCYQTIDARHKTRCIKDMEAKTSEKSRELEKANSELSAWVADTRTELQVLDLEDQLGKIKATARNSVLRAQSLRERAATLRAQLDSEKERRQTLLTSENPYAKIEAKVHNDHVEAKEKIGELKAELEEAQTQQRATSYWVKGFKQIRLGLIDEALHLLEAEVNTALFALGLAGWSVTFAVERETKSGGVSKGFTVCITPPGGNRPIPWEAWSGGEGQRLRLAGRIGLASLILGRKGVSTNVEIWDEPTAFLSQAGIDDLVSLLQDRAATLQRQIYLVDHRTLDLGGFDGHILVVKDQNGSRIEDHV